MGYREEAKNKGGSRKCKVREAGGLEPLLPLPSRWLVAQPFEKHLTLQRLISENLGDFFPANVQGNCSFL